MLDSYQEIYYAVILTAFVMIFLVVVFLTAIVKYQGRLHRHRQEKRELETKFTETLLHAQLEIQSQTMNNISLEIHDNVGQVLSLAKLNLATLPSGDDKQMFEKIEGTRELIAKAINDLRNLARGLNEDRISQLGLKDALEIELQNLQRSGHFDTNFIVVGDAYRIGKQKELILFRIAQEAFNNVIKHAQATQIATRLEYDPGFFSMTIHDNGKGFDDSAPGVGPKGIGLENMRSRARLVGGSFEIKNNNGTEIITRLPFNSIA